MMGMRMPETCWAVFKRQVINLRSCCIWLDDSVESMRMHGLEKTLNPKWALANYFFGVGTCFLSDVTLRRTVFGTNLRHRTSQKREGHLTKLPVEKTSLTWVNEGAALVEWYWQKKNRRIWGCGEPLSLPLGTQQKSRGMERDRARACAVRYRRLTPWDTVRSALLNKVV